MDRAGVCNVARQMRSFDASLDFEDEKKVLSQMQPFLRLFIPHQRFDRIAQ